MTQEAMKLALEALKWSKPHEDAVISHSEAITAIEEALAQPEQEPCVHAKNPKECYRVRCQLGDKCVDDEMSFRTTPPQNVIDKSAAIRIATALGWTPPRTWVGLTDEEIWTVLQFRGYNTDTIEIARAIEARLKERNT